MHATSFCLLPVVHTFVTGLPTIHTGNPMCTVSFNEFACSVNDPTPYLRYTAYLPPGSPHIASPGLSVGYTSVSTAPLQSQQHCLLHTTPYVDDSHSDPLRPPPELKHGVSLLSLLPVSLSSLLTFHLQQICYNLPPPPRKAQCGCSPTPARPISAI